MNDAMARIPYSKRGLESLAAAMNINSGSLWINPGTGALSLREGAVFATRSSNPAADRFEAVLEEEQE